ncbi:hypothetical protein Lepto7376_4545 [[Leptolyngbya] sp. PCC 7376]|uniref:hypothetical protein n=1 Tax=[Leptolyngbya] sp. PCC 7376 TaxID=111781 RepID=UPI00029F10CE|nr:hypothetical protein [[Leptolyngbya] sp. PCC 7376]AFY40643.1 hypothetical protein Lepto7376_4545 [[Leptolyngbya] sp. PCC 7376]
MSIWYNKRDNADSASLGNVENESTSIEFTQGKMVLDSSGNFATLILLATSCTNLAKRGDSNPSLDEKGEPVKLDITIKDYEKSYQDKKTKKTATEFGVWLVEYIKETYGDKGFSGRLTFGSLQPTSLESLKTGKKQDGSDLTDEMKEFLMETALKLEPCEDTSEVDKVNLSGGYSNFRKPKTAQDRLKEVLELLNEGVEKEEEKLKSFSDVVLLLSNQEQVERESYSAVLGVLVR